MDSAYKTQDTVLTAICYIKWVTRLPPILYCEPVRQPA